jgi:hypothetical protein
MLWMLEPGELSKVADYGPYDKGLITHAARDFSLHHRVLSDAEGHETFYPVSSVLKVVSSGANRYEVTSHIHGVQDLESLEREVVLTKRKTSALSTVLNVLLHLI